MRYSQIVEARLPRGFRAFRMPARTTVYHGTGATFSPSEIESPCWVSTKFDVAKYFSDWHSHWTGDDEDEPEDHKGTRIIEFVTTKPLRLLYVESRQTFDDIEERFGFDMRGGSTEMAEVICKLGYDGWHIEANYNDGDDTMICDASALRYVTTHRIG